MNFRADMQKAYCQITQTGNLLLRLLWHFVHFIISIRYFTIGVAYTLESYLISSGFLKSYQALNISKLKYLAIVVESEDAYHTLEVIKLLQWLADLGVKQLCLYDTEGVLKKSKEDILEKLNSATLFEEANENDTLLEQKYMTLEFASLSDGKEAVAKAANLLFEKYLKLGNFSEDQEDQIFTETGMTEALKTTGCRGPEPDLLLVYGPARCHLGFPAWRIRYSEIIHMGPLKSMRYGSLIKAIYRFTMVRQNYGK